MDFLDDPWTLDWTRLSSPGLFFHLSCALWDCALVKEDTALAFPALHTIFPRHFQNRTKSFYLPSSKRSKGKKHKCLPESHTKSSTNISWTCSTSRVLLNWSWVHVELFGARIELHTSCTKACCNMGRVQTLLLLGLKEISPIYEQDGLQAPSRAAPVQ